MPRRFIKKYIPDHRSIKEHKLLKIFGDLLHDSNLWHLNRRSVSGAFAVGFFCAFIPLPSQMVFAAAAAILLRVNLPVSVALVWISNPVTMPPLFYAAYKLGSHVLGQETMGSEYHLTLEWFSSQLDLIWQPFLLGCLILAIITAAIAYCTIRLLWRLHLIRHLQVRKARKARKTRLLEKRSRRS